ncbi:putative transmembrane protein, partial [Toxoplasma gondii p89]
SLSSSASSASCSSVFARSPAVRGEVFEPQRARATETEAEAEKSCFDDATVHIVYPPDLFASGFLPRFWRGSQAAARRRSSSGDTGGGSVPLPGADARGQRLSWGRVSAEGLDCFDGDEDETLAVCKYLLATGQLADIPEWRPLQVLQGQLLQLAAVILPGDTVLEAGPVALEEWIRKFSTLSATVDLVAAEARGTNAKAGKTKSSALSCQFWEAQAFPIDAQESLSVEVTPYTYEVVQSTQSAPCADERRHVSPLLPTVSPPSFSEGVDTPQASLTGCGRREDRGEAKDRVQRAEEARREDGEEGAERGEEDRGEEGRVTRIDSAMLGKAGLPEDVLRQVSSERFCFIVDIRIPMTVNPQYLGKSLLLELTFSIVPGPLSSLSPVEAMRESIQIPFSAWAAARGLNAASAVSLQSDLAAPTLDLLNVPFSSSLTGARFGAFARRDLNDSGTSGWWAPPVGAGERLSQEDGLGDRVGRTTEILVQSIASLASGVSAAKNKMQSTTVEHRVLCPLSVRRPLQVTTALMDSFMYVQIENTTVSFVFFAVAVSLFVSTVMVFCGFSLAPR